MSNDVSDENDEIDEQDSMDPVAYRTEYAAARKELERRCSEAGLELRESEGIEEDDVTLEVGLPAGRETRWVYLFDLDDLRQILHVSFEQFVFLSGYDAICSYRSGEIEALVRPLNALSRRLLQRRIFGRREGEEADEYASSKLELVPDAPLSGPKIVLSQPTENIRALARANSGLSVRLVNAGVTQHDQAAALLEKFTRPLFFQIDLLTNVPLSIQSARGRGMPMRRASTPEITSSLQYPRNEYDDAPLSLYWYARSAVGMPLLEFLAFYQVIEFYFPTYSRAEANRRIRGILKDPTFRHDRDADVSRILSAIQLNRGGGLGDERSQLKATLMECVDAERLRQFLEGNEERKAFLSSKGKPLTSHRIPIGNAGADLRDDVAQRIYDIRCKIVHTKSDGAGDVELLLPFSKEAAQMAHDIGLIEFVAKQVLIAASTVLSPR